VRAANDAAASRETGIDTVAGDTFAKAAISFIPKVATKTSKIRINTTY